MFNVYSSEHVELSMSFKTPRAELIVLFWGHSVKKKKKRLYLNSTKVVVNQKVNIFSPLL